MAEDTKRATTESRGDARRMPNRSSNGLLCAKGALYYASKGWRVHPVEPGTKKVRVRWRLGEADPSKLIAPSPSMSEHEWWRTWGDLQSTTDQNVIKAWWTGRPDSLVGCQTGRVSDLVVLDVDQRDDVDGEATLSRLEARLGKLPETIEQVTPSGGRQLFFAYPPGWHKVTTRAHIGASSPGERTGLDVRGDGGQTVLPPSRRNGGEYRWDEGRSPRQMEPAQLPESWRAVLEEQPPAPRPPGQRPSVKAGDGSHPWCAAMLEAIVDELASMPSDSGRNARLFWASRRLHEYEAWLEPGRIEPALLAACHANGLVESDGQAAVEATIASGARRGRANPKDPPDDEPRRQTTRPRTQAPPPAPPAEDTDGDEPPPEEDDDGVTGERTDLANAEALLSEHGEDMLHCKVLGGWLVWDGARFAIDRTGAAERLAKGVARKSLAKAIEDLFEAAEELEEATRSKDDERIARAKARHEYARSIRAFAERSQNTSAIKNTLESASTERGVSWSPDDIDADPWLMNTLSGTVDLRTGELREHRREDRLTRLAPVAYSPDAAAPVWEAFLSRIFDGDEALVSSVQRHLGYAITGLVREEVTAIYYGSGSNGKSTMIGAVAEALGDYYRQIDVEVIMPKQTSSKVDSEKAQLKGVRLAMCAETSSARTMDDGLLKQISSSDRIIAKKLYADSFEFKPTHSLLLVTNHKPIIKTTDAGTWRRLMLVPFNVTIPESEIDKTLGEKLRGEGPGILRWLVEGCLEWQRLGLAPCATIKEATSDYRCDQDVMSDFFAHCVVMSEGAKTNATTLYKRYAAWAEENLGEKPVSQRAFGEALTERGLKKVTSRGRKVYCGIGLAAERDGDIDEEW